MRKRTKSREVAIQILYQMEVRVGDIQQELQMFLNMQDLDAEILDFALSLAKECRSKREEIEEKIISTSENWNLDRMAIIDKCILSLGVYELLYRDDIPPKVSINEAIDLAKKFSTESSGTFVNGILDKVYAKYKK